jgi:hypothetical protein
MWFFYGLDYAFGYACFYDTSMGHYTWYLVPSNELSITAAARPPAAGLVAVVQGPQKLPIYFVFRMCVFMPVDDVLWLGQPICLAYRFIVN